MNNQLALLISIYEKEEIQLQKLVDECLTEREFLMANHHSRALGRLYGTLNVLKTIDDKLFFEKEFKRKKIENLIRLIKEADSDYIRANYEKDLERTKSELEKLNQMPKQEVDLETETLLEETLVKLVDNKVKNLKLILKKSENLFFAFSYSKKVLKVTLPYVKQHIKKCILDEDKMNRFITFGFRLNENGTCLSLILTGEKIEILNTLKLILLKIVFEVFYFKEFDNESYIKFTEKAAHNI